MPGSSAPSTTAAVTPTVRPARTTGLAADDGPWWRDAVTYQVYIRSFADGDGDGVGDIGGIRSRLPYLRALGVDAIWVNPWYPSPMADGGYDVSDYRGIEPVFGTLDGAEALIREAHEHGLRLIVDIVPNHTSSRHPWFEAALAAGPGSRERRRYLFRDGRGPDGAEPPNDWLSVFHGPAWTRVTEPDGTPGQWYLHLFATEQPDLDWDDPDVRAEFESILRFWFDRGVDGVRIDVAHGVVKAPGLPDLGVDPAEDVAPPDRPDHPHWDQDGLHEIYRAWRRLADAYADPRILVAEANVARPERLARYVRRDELHSAFIFDFLGAPWRADRLREAIDRVLASLGEVGAPPTWVLSNHDVVREVSRYARPQPERAQGWHACLADPRVDLALGTRRARAAALLMLALPGSACLYQGEELGLWEVEDLPEEALQDPTWERSGRTDRGRDGCRVPLPWSGDAPPFGFSGSDAHAAPWLPQPPAWATVTAERQDADPASMLALYRTALELRRAHPALGDGALAWLWAPPAVLAFRREPGLVCVANLSGAAVALPVEGRVLLGSDELTADRRLPADAAVWIDETAATDR